MRATERRKEQNIATFGADSPALPKCTLFHVARLTNPRHCVRPIATDNLYLDMNGIIHNCSHSDDSNDSTFSQLTENDMFGKVLVYIDHIFSVVRPRKLLYLAIDGTCRQGPRNRRSLNLLEFCRKQSLIFTLFSGYFKRFYAYFYPPFLLF